MSDSLAAMARGFDYYGLMHRFMRLVGPSLLAALVSGTTWAQPSPSSLPEPLSAPESISSADSDSRALLDAQLFYEILLAEITTRQGDPSTGYALMLDAARATGDPQLYRRSVDIALRSRSGEAAWEAVQAWAEHAPESREANRYALQILLALNRVSETESRLAKHVATTPLPARSALVQAIPQLYERASDKANAARVVEKALAPELDHNDRAGSSWATIARLRLAAGENEAALQAAERALELDPKLDSAALAALELLARGIPQAQDLLERYFAAGPTPELRLAYAQVLLEQHNTQEAVKQLETLSQALPQRAQVWLALAHAHSQRYEWESAYQTLKLALEPPVSAEQAVPLTDVARSQVYSRLAEAAEKQRRLAEADTWLQKIEPTPERRFVIQVQRAALKARHGALPEALEILEQANDAHAEMASSDQALAARVMVLRDARDYEQAYTLQSEIVRQKPDSDGALYEQAMLAERLGRIDEMEKILRRILQRSPDYYAAYNALGYTLADQGTRLEEAKTLIEKALSFSPNDPFMRDSLAWVEFRMGNSDRAAAIFSDIFQRKPDAEIAAHWGEVLWSLGHQEEALTVWQRGQESDPYNETLRSTLQRFGILR